MIPIRGEIAVGVALAALVAPGSVAAQSLGTFRWQLQPYCNVVTVNVAQSGAVYTLDGYDDQCGAATRAPLVGLATPNPDGTIGFGMQLVTTPSATPVAVQASITLAALGGAWSDSAGNSGTLVFNGPGTGSPRPAAVPAFPSGLAAGGARVTNVGAPTQASDAANKDYVDTRLPAAFTFNADGGFVARAAAGGLIPATGAGQRVMWHPGLYALRAGGVSGTHWDHANTGQYSTAFGASTIASGPASTALGQNTVASGSGSLAGGASTVASGANSIALGNAARAQGPTAVALGLTVGACGSAATALGAYASTSAAPTLGNLCGGTPHDAAFVFSGYSGSVGESMFGTVANSEFAVRAQGGVRLRTNATASTGCNLAAGSGTWACTSDRNQKQDFEPVDGDNVLAKLARMPIDRWSYKSEPGVRHVGPTAQDFRAAFGLGVDDTSIGHIDLAGISLRAIQALEARTQQLADDNRALRVELDELRRLLTVVRVP